MVWRVVIGCLVQNFGTIAQGEKAMRETRWNPELFLVLCGESFTNPFAKGSGISPKVDYHIENLTVDNSNQLALSLGRHLVVETTQDIPGGFGMIVLHEIGCEPCCSSKGLSVETFEKESAVIAEDPGFDNKDVGNRSGCNFHQNTFSRSNPCRYRPYPVLA